MTAWSNWRSGSFAAPYVGAHSVEAPCQTRTIACPPPSLTRRSTLIAPSSRLAREHNLDVLGQRGVLLFGGESDDELADLWSAVDRFESVVEARGGDTFTNAPDSSEPENPEFVLPERKAREPVAEYVRRIQDAAERLTRFERESEAKAEGGGEA
jgi:hypothetical protein